MGNVITDYLETQGALVESLDEITEECVIAITYIENPMAKDIFNVTRYYPEINDVKPHEALELLWENKYVVVVFQGEIQPDGKPKSFGVGHLNFSYAVKQAVTNRTFPALTFALDSESELYQQYVHAEQEYHKSLSEK